MKKSSVKSSRRCAEQAQILQHRLLLPGGHSFLYLGLEYPRRLGHYTRAHHGVAKKHDSELVEGFSDLLNCHIPSAHGAAPTDTYMPLPRISLFLSSKLPHLRNMRNLKWII